MSERTKGSLITVVVIVVAIGAFYLANNLQWRAPMVDAKSSPAPVSVAPAEAGQAPVAGAPNANSATLSEDAYKTMVQARWQLLAETTDEYARTIKKYVAPKNAASKRDKLAEIKSVALRQVGQLTMAAKDLSVTKPPAGFEAFHQHLVFATKDTVANFNGAINLCGDPRQKKDNALKNSANGASGEFKACQADERMKLVLKPYFDANILSDAADKIFVIHDSQLEVPKVVPPAPPQVIVINNSGPVTDVPVSLPAVSAPSSYMPAMRSLLNQYLDSRTDMQRWCSAVRRNSANSASYDNLLITCLNTRRAILGQMQQLSPDGSYVRTHQFCVQILQSAVSACESAARTRNPDDPSLQQVSRFINQYQGEIARAYSIRL